MGSKQLQYTHCSISQEVKTIRQLNLNVIIEYNMRNIFLEKSYTKCLREAILKSFSKKPKLRISLNQQLKLLYSLFSLSTNFRAIEIYRNYHSAATKIPFCSAYCTMNIFNNEYIQVEKVLFIS